MQRSTSKQWSELWRSYWGKGGGTVSVRGVMRGNTQRQQIVPCRNSLPKDPLLGNICGSSLGPLHVCDSFVPWSLYKAPGIDIQTCPWILAGFCHPVLHAGLPCYPWCKLRRSTLPHLDGQHFVEAQGGLLLSDWRWRRSGMSFLTPLHWAQALSSWH